jgi:hypothetical protein
MTGPFPTRRFGRCARTGAPHGRELAAGVRIRARVWVGIRVRVRLRLHRTRLRALRLYSRASATDRFDRLRPPATVTSIFGALPRMDRSVRSRPAWCRGTERSDPGPHGRSRRSARARRTNPGRRGLDEWQSRSPRACCLFMGVRGRRGGVVGASGHDAGEHDHRRPCSRARLPIQSESAHERRDPGSDQSRDVPRSIERA